MKCETIISLIDQYFDSEEKKLPQQISTHINECDSCQAYYHAGLQLQDLSIKLHSEEPVLNDPERLADDIMSALKDGSETVAGTNVRRRIPVIQSIMFRRLISAAAILLFALFSYEQIIILDKINRLETNNQNRLEQVEWEVRTVIKYQQVKEDHKVLIKLIESFRDEPDPESGTLQKYFQYRRHQKTNTPNNMGVQ